MKALIAQSAPSPSPPSPTLYPWAEGAIVLAAIAYLIRTVFPAIFSSWLKRSELEASQDLQNEAITLSTVLNTLTKMQDALLVQQNTLISSLLNTRQIEFEDRQLENAISSQNKILETLVGNQEAILKHLQQVDLNREQDSIQN
jgi:hypothetical protein